MNARPHELFLHDPNAFGDSVRSRGISPGVPVAEVADLGGSAWKTGAKRDSLSRAEVSDLGYETAAPGNLSWLCRAPEVRRAGKSKLSITLMLSVSIGFAAPAVAIVGGAGDASSFGDRVVMVLTRGPEGSGFCSAVVVGPRLVLTAAHCLRAPANMRVHFLDPAGRPVVLEVAAVLPHPEYRPDAQRLRTRSLDIGLVETKEALPEAFRPATLAEDGPPEPGAAVTVVGFGLSREGDAKSGGRLRQAKLRVREPRSRVLLWSAPIEGDAGGCSGDSGGPIFGRDEKTVVAIVAWTDGKGESKCGKLTQGVLVAPIADWLRAAIGRFNGGIAAEIGQWRRGANRDAAKKPNPRHDNAPFAY